MSKNEPKEKVTYALNSLITEITGVSEFDGEDYDNARTQVYRISKSIRKAMGSNQGMPEITEEEKDSFVRLMRKFYEDKEYRKILRKHEDAKAISLEEQDLLIDFIGANLAQDLPDDEKQAFLDAIEFQKDDESSEIAENIQSRVHDDLVAIMKLDYIPAKREFLEQYSKVLEEAVAPLLTSMEIFVRLRATCNEFQEKGRLNGGEDRILANPEFILEFARSIVTELQSEQE